MKSKKMKVIRSAVGSMPSLGLIRELQKRGVEVIGVDANPLSFGLYLLKRSYVIPPGNHPNFIREISEIIDMEQPDAILSGPEEELLALSRNKKEIEEKGTLVLCPDYPYVRICADKKRTNEALRDIEIPIPEVYVDKASVKYPCIVKPRFGRGSVGINVVKDEEDLNLYFRNFDEQVIQRFVQGNEYTIDVLADQEGNALSIVPRLRLQTESGVSVKGKTTYDAKIIEYSKKIAKELKLFGPSCIQCIKNKEGLNFIEVNTRFGGGSILSVKADPTIMTNLINIIKRKKTKPSKGFKEGLIMLRYHSEVFLTEDIIKRDAFLTDSTEPY